MKDINNKFAAIAKYLSNWMDYDKREVIDNASIDLLIRETETNNYVKESCERNFQEVTYTIQQKIQE